MNWIKCLAWARMSKRMIDRGISIDLLIKIRSQRQDYPATSIKSRRKKELWDWEMNRLTTIESRKQAKKLRLQTPETSTSSKPRRV